MSVNRRGFLGYLGAGLGAAGAAFAGKRLNADEVPEQIEQGEPTRQGILRLAQVTSTWVQDGQVEAGNFFTHQRYAMDCIDLGNRLRCKGCQFIGWKAMRFTDFSKGSKPVEQYTNPLSDGYAKICIDAKDPMTIGCLNGPVYVFMLRDGSEEEFFCINKSQRKFAAQELGIDPCFEDSFILKSKKVQDRHSCYWYVPTLENETHILSTPKYRV